MQDETIATNALGRVSRFRRPDGISLEEWQIALRRQFGQEQTFKLENLGQEPILSEFAISNPQSKRVYRLVVRGLLPGDNYCACPDFAINTLGTCKHIEFALAKLQRKRGGKKALQQGFQPQASELYVRYGARRQVIFKPRPGCSEKLLHLLKSYFDTENVLKPHGYRHFFEFLKKANAFEPTLRCYDDTLTFVTQVRDQELLRERVKALFPNGVDSTEFDGLLKTPLYPYQRHGALFAASCGRSILADDMGLGKTVQAIAASEILARAMGVERVLVVCPTSLKHQWKSEIDKFTNRTAEVINGLSHIRQRGYQSAAFFKIVNYEVIHSDLDSIRAWGPELIILDEAQRIKNWKTRRAQSVKQLSSPYSLVLTGTPLENRLEELHSIVEFVDRFHLGPLFRFLDAHQSCEVGTGRVIGYKNLSNIAETLKAILLRRTKSQVLKDLPKRLDKHFFVPMTPEQMTIHSENDGIVVRIVQKWRRYGFLTEQDQLRLQIALQNMRMSCNSTYLIDQRTDHGTKVPELMTLLAEILEDPDVKVVIFSQWVRTHELILKSLAARKLQPVFLHGSLSTAKRKDIIERFQRDRACRIFLSTDAGGLGLNLQSASCVINMDQPWNPAVLEQRIARVHRLGQKRTVNVFHFVAEGTIEQGLLGTLSFKKSLFSGVFDNGENEISLGGNRLKVFMDSIQQVTQGTTSSTPPSSTAAEKKEEFKTPALENRPAVPNALITSLASGAAAFLEHMVATMPQCAEILKNVPRTAEDFSKWLVRDDKTGETALKIPLPRKETFKNLSQVFLTLGDMFGERG